MSWRIVTAVALCFTAAPGLAQLSVTCPPGFDGVFNANKLGCTFCASNAPECSSRCAPIPLCRCEEDQLETCCAAHPCCGNCPGPKPLECSLASCSCDSESCCMTLCPAGAPATGSKASLLLVGVLAALGVVAVRRRTRAR
jgi:hypothetical protein